MYLSASAVPQRPRAWHVLRTRPERAQLSWGVAYERGLILARDWPHV